MTLRAAAARVVAVAAIVAAAACSRAPRLVLPDAPVALDLGRPPIINPLNLRDLAIPGATSVAEVGSIDGVAVSIDELDARSGKPFSRIGERIYDARDAAWRWLLERTALERLAAADHLDLPSLLRREYARLPAPPAAELDGLLAAGAIAELPAAERRSAAVALWRVRHWEILRSLLVQRGLAGVAYGRLQLMLIAPGIERPETVVARIGGRDVTRAELHRLASYEEPLAQDEYVHVAELQFAERTSELLLQREAKQRRITVAVLEARALAAAPPLRDADVRAFVRDNPAYARDPQGHTRAVAVVENLRQVHAHEQLLARLRAGAHIVFSLRRPGFDRLRPEMVAPLRHGSGPATLTALHGLGCDNCARGTRLVIGIAAAHPQLRVESGEYFSRERLGSYRAALAVRCADEQGKAWELMVALARDFRRGLVDELTAEARPLGLDERRFRRCLDEDRALPIIFENVALAERLGLERNVPALFVNGTRLDDLADPTRLQEHVTAALALPPLP